jgi:hypothetical protein
MPHHAHSIDRWDNAIGSNLYNTTAAVALSRNGNRTEHNGSHQAHPQREPVQEKQCQAPET